MGVAVAWSGGHCRMSDILDNESGRSNPREQSGGIPGCAQATGLYERESFRKGKKRLHFIVHKLLHNSIYAPGHIINNFSI